MKFFICFLSFLTPVIMSLPQAKADSDVYEGSLSGEQVADEQDEYADVSVNFVAGTAFIAKMSLYDADGKNVRKLGAFGVGGHWNSKLPVDSHVRVKVKGPLAEICWYFDVIQPTTGTVSFWGTYIDAQYSIQGDAIKLGLKTGGYWTCPEPDYEQQ